MKKIGVLFFLLISFTAFSQKKLFEAIYNKDFTNAILLAEEIKPANVNKPEGRNDETLLTAAVKHELFDVTHILLEKGADVSFRNHHDEIPLHIAALNGDTAMTNLLIKYKSNVQAKDDKGQTPLHLAVANGNHLVVKSLINAGSNVNEPDKNGNTPLHYSVVCENTQELSDTVLKILDILDRRFELDGADSIPVDALGARLLLRYKVPVHKYDTNYFVYKNIYYELFCPVPYYLYIDGANRVAQNNDGETPLNYALRNSNNNITATVFLLINKFGLQIPDNKGVLPFHNALLTGKPYYVKYMNNLEMFTDTAYLSKHQIGQLICQKYFEHTSETMQDPFNSSRRIQNGEYNCNMAIMYLDVAEQFMGLNNRNFSNCFINLSTDPCLSYTRTYNIRISAIRSGADPNYIISSFNTSNLFKAYYEYRQAMSSYSYRKDDEKAIARQFVICLLEAGAPVTELNTGSDTYYKSYENVIVMSIHERDLDMLTVFLRFAGKLTPENKQLLINKINLYRGSNINVENQDFFDNAFNLVNNN